MTVRIFRTGSSAAAVVTTPDQAGLLVGPAYHLIDYVAGETPVFSAYGDAAAASDADQNGRPIDGSTVFSGVPTELPAGSLLDRASLRLRLQNVLYEVATGDDGTRDAANTFSTVDPNIDFAALGVRPGDRLVITDADTEATVVATILTVGGYGTAGSALDANELRVLDEFNTDDLSDGELGSYLWRVEKALDSAIIEGTAAGLGGSGNTVVLRGGLVLSLDPDGSGVSSEYPVNSCDVCLEFRALRQDLTAMGTVSSVDEVVAQVGPIDERNPLGLGLFLALANTTTPIQYIGVDGDDLNGASDSTEAYLAALDVLENSDEVYAIGLLTASETVVAAYAASVYSLSQPESSVFRLLVAGIDEIPTTAERSGDGDAVAEQVDGDIVRVFSADDGGFEEAGVQEGDRLFIVAGTTGADYGIEARLSDQTVLLSSAATAGAASRQFFVLAPNGATYGIPRATHAGGVRVARTGGVDRVFVPGARTLASERVGMVVMLTEPSEDPTYYMVTAVTAAEQATYALAGTDIVLTALPVGRASMPGEAEELAITVVHGAELSVAIDTDSVPYVITLTVVDGVSDDEDIEDLINNDPDVSQYVTASGATAGATTIDPVVEDSFSGGEFAFYTVVGPAALPGAEEDDWSGEVRQARVSAPVAAASTFRKQFRRLYDAGASFTSGSTPVAVGDYVEIPDDFDEDGYAGTVWQGRVQEVQSGQRLLLEADVDLQVPDLSTTSSTAALAHYRVVRSLDAAGKVAELVARTEALNSEAVVLQLPARVSVGGVVDGRTGSASQLPGYYLAAAVVGLIAGTPPHQGLTQRSLAGITRVHGADQFSRAQLDTLAQSGWMAWAQRRRSSPPLCVRQSTTWQGTELELRELSMVRAYHFAATAVKAAVESFLGSYNVGADSLDGVRTVVRTTLGSLQSGRVPRIGSVLTSATLGSVSQSTTRPDVIEVRIDWGFPAPVNQIDIYTRG